MYSEYFGNDLDEVQSDMYLSPSYGVYIVQLIRYSRVCSIVIVTSTTETNFDC